MKTLPLLLLSSSLLGQAPQAEPRIPREPSRGEMHKAPPVPVVRNAPATTTVAPPQTTNAPGKPLPAGVMAALIDDQQHEVLFDVPQEGGALWALGTDYKASFEASQWTFIARPTAAAERLQPLTFRLASAQVGGKALSLSTGPAAERVGNLVHLVRGAVVETLDLRPQAIEQTFTFASLPQRGELVLGIALDTELVGRQQGDGLRFTGAWTDVGYTGAIAIDADGDRIAASTRLVDGGIEIRVPAEFVAAASLPLVIDPLVSSGIAISGNVDVGNPDLVYAPTTNEWHVVFQRSFGAGNWDCFARRMDAYFAPLGTVIAIDITTNSWTRPRIAHLQGSNVSMVVGELRLPATAVKVSGRILNNAGTLATGQFDIAAVGRDSLVPDVGGDPYPAVGAGYFTVVWQYAFSATDHDIYMRQVTYTGALRGTGPTSVQASGAFEANPAISKSDGAGSSWNQLHAIVYQRRVGTADWDIFGSFYSWDGVVQPVSFADNFPIDVSSASNVLPSVSTPSRPDSSGIRRFLCVYENPSSNAGDIEMTAFTNAGVVLARDNLVDAEGSLLRLGWPQRSPSVDCDGTRFAVGYHENFNNSPTDLDARITTVSVGPNELFAMDGAAPGATDSPEFAVQIASRHSSSGVQDPGYATVNDRDTGLTFVIEGDTYASDPTSLKMLRSTACGSGAVLSSIGNPAPGNTVTINLTASTPIAGFSVGTENNLSLPGCSCIVGVDSFLVQLGPVLTINVPGNAGIIGARLSVQGWRLGTPGSSCLADIHLSNTIDLLVR
jgi:hypothetical protein